MDQADIKRLAGLLARFQAEYGDLMEREQTQVLEDAQGVVSFIDELITFYESEEVE
jgi:hypothetical protein